MSSVLMHEWGDQVFVAITGPILMIVIPKRFRFPPNFLNPLAQGRKSW